MRRISFVGRYGVMAEPSGLYYMRARYYDPNVGRFISEDPIGFGGGDVNFFAYVDSVGKPAALTNPNVYASDNPVNRIDPLGLFDVGAGVIDRPMLPLEGGGGGGIPFPIPPFPITKPDSPACQSNDDATRCKKVLDSCRDDCVDIYANNPDWLPGTGTDMKGRIRRCIRDCMQSNRCHDY
jgi:RHS repeat-associated protein